MQIPMGTYGQAVARPGPLVNVQRGDPIGDAAQRVGQAGEAIVNDMATKQTKLDEERRRADAALTLAKTSNAMHDAHDEVAKGVQDGTIPVDKAPAELQTRVGKVREKALEGFEPSQRMQLEAPLEGITGTLQRKLQGTVDTRVRHDAAGSIDAFGEEMSRNAMRTGPAAAVTSYAAFVKNTAGIAGLDEGAQSKLVQKFSEAIHANFYTAAGVAALTKGDDAALRQLREQLAGPAGEPLDPQKRAVLTHTLFGWEQHILAGRDRAANQQEEAARKKNNQAVDLFNQAADLSLAGAFLKPEFIAELVETAAGTPMAPRVQNLIASQRVVAGFASLPVDKRAERIERFRSERANPQVGVDPLDEKLLGAMTTMHEKLQRQVDENPWAAAQGAGVIKDAPAFNLADPATAVKAIQERMQQIGAVEVWAGRKISPLQPQEVEQLGKFVRQLPLDQAATVLANIGGALGDGERVASLGKQLHDKDGSLGLAMMYASAQTTEGRKTAQLVLRGDQALKDKTAMIDKAAETGWQSKLAKAIRGAYSNREVEDRAIDAAFKITAGQYADGQGADLDRAVRLATGGIVERNGVKVPLPYGMTEGEFEKRIASPDLRPGIEEQARDGQVFVGRTPMSVDQFVASLPKASLVHAGQGLYNVRAGSALVTNSAGKRISLRIAP